MKKIQTQINTPLGPMIAIADDEALYMLDFAAAKDNYRSLHAANNAILTKLSQELNLYFKGQLTQFSVPLHIRGTDFQQSVWRALCAIPYGSTISYQDQAANLGKPTAYRAVANANGKNKFAIIIPCHRVVRSNGNLGGYAGGIHRKEWLLQHEQRTPTSPLISSSAPSQP